MMENGKVEKNLHLRQGPLEFLAVLVVTLGEGDHPLIVSCLPAAFAVLSEARPSVRYIQNLITFFLTRNFYTLG